MGAHRGGGENRRSPPPPLSHRKSNIFLLLYGWPFTNFSQWGGGAFLVRFFTYGGPFSPCEGLSAPFSPCGGLFATFFYFNLIRSGLFQTANDPGGALKSPPPPRSRKLLCQSSQYHTCAFYQVF